MVSVHPLFKHCDFCVGLAVKKVPVLRQNKGKTYLSVNIYYQFIPIEEEDIERKYEVFPTGRNLIQNKQTGRKPRKILKHIEFICALVILVMLIFNFIFHSPVEAFASTK